MRTSRWLVAVAVVTVVAVAPACSDDDDDGGGNPVSDDADGGSGSGSDVGGGDDQGAGDTVESAGWGATTAIYRQEIGERFVFDCPSDGQIGSVWGTGPFTDDSSVCSAAVFAGEITVEDGGRVMVGIVEGQDSYEAGEENSVTAKAYGEWPGSFIVIDGD